MSAEDDTFDIDIYGEETAEQDTTAESADQVQGTEDNTTIKTDPDDTHATEQPEIDENSVGAQAGGGDESNDTNKNITGTQPQQGIKRKASDDDDDLYEGEADEEPFQQKPDQSSGHKPSTTPAPDTRPVDPSATSALHFSPIDWWTTEDDLRAYVAAASVSESTELRDIRIAEHGQNGKSRGEAYLEFSSPQAATAVKGEVEKQNKAAQEGSKVKRPTVGVVYTAVGNPFRGAGEKFAGGRGGTSAYNSRGGGFVGRGGRGGFTPNQNQNRGGFAGQGGYGTGRGQGGQWGMNGGMNNGMNAGMNAGMNPGFTPNPMMAGFNMGMGGFPAGGMNMGRGGNMMMGRGNMTGGMMGGMMNRGGMMGGMGGMNGMMGRGGGWGGGFQGGMQQQQQQGGGYGGGGQPQKRQRNE